MLRQTALLRFVEFARRHRVDLPGQVVACAKPHRRRVARDPSQSFGTSASRRFERLRTTEGGRKRNGCFAARGADKRTFAAAELRDSKVIKTGLAKVHIPGF